MWVLTTAAPGGHPRVVRMWLKFACAGNGNLLFVGCLLFNREQTNKTKAKQKNKTKSQVPPLAVRSSTCRPIILTPARRSFARLCVLSQSVVAGHVAGRRVWVIGRHGLPVLVGRRLLAMIVSIAVAGTRCHGSARTKARGTTANHRPPTAVPSTT